MHANQNGYKKKLKLKKILKTTKKESPTCKI